MSRPHARRSHPGSRSRGPTSAGGGAPLFAGRGNAALAEEHAASRAPTGGNAAWLGATAGRFFQELGKGTVTEGLTHGVASLGEAAGVQFSGAGPLFPEAVARGGPLGRMAEPLTGAASGGAVVGGAFEAGLEALEQLETARQPAFDASDATGDVVAAGLVGTLMGGVGIGAGSLLLGAGELLAPAALAGAGVAAAPLAMLAGGALAATAFAGGSEALTGWLGDGLGAALDPAEGPLRRLWRGAGSLTGLSAPPPRAGRRPSR